MKKRKAKVNSFCGRAARWVNAHLLRPFGLVLVQDMHIARPRSCRDVAYAGTDFIRYNTLGLLAQEIRQNKVPGACAELGVFQGDFACEISKLLPERKIYLYDTFEGFSAQDLTTEQARKFSLAEECFANTDVALVRAKMPHINQCVFRKGIFPQSAQQDGQERFCLVSLDADLYEPLYAGLKFFYERLSPGGYILVHDYGNPRYKGAAQAVRNFAREYKQNFVPLCDHLGSVVFTK